MIEGTKPVAGRIRQLVDALHAASASLPAVMAVPARRRAWLLGAHRAQLAAVVLLLLGLFLLPSVRDAAISAWLPSKVSGGFLGFGRRTRRHPWAEPARALVTGAYWLGALSTVGGLLWLQLPLAAGLSPVRRREGEADDDDEVRPALAATALAVTGADARASAATGEVHAGATDDPGDTPPQRYTVERELGRGGMGIVCLARDGVLGRRVALKQLHPEWQQNSEVATRFRREAQVLAGLTHRHIVQIFDLHAEPSGLWMAMEYVDGGSLSDRLERGAPIALAETLQLAQEMAEALAHAHAQGIVHRDFKPGNVMLTGDGTAKVTDFGLAALTDAAAGADATKLTRPGAIMGSPAYMSPEQISGQPVDARTDVYALGATLYELCSGAPPFTGNVTAVLTQHLTTPPVLPPPGATDFPEALSALLSDMLEKDPAARLGSMGAVLARLHTVSVS